MNEETLFAEAFAIKSPEERSRFLDTACADNRELRQAVEKLLCLATDAGNFLEHSPVEAVVAELNVSESAASATIAYESGSTHDDDPDATTFYSHGTAPMTKQQDDAEFESALEYLEPSSKPDSLGRLAHYEVLEVVGRGAFGTVLRAFDEKLQRVVAIKVMSPEMAATSPARKRFIREAQSSAAIRHEHVVSVYAVEEKPLPYLVMEFIPGQTLQQRLDQTGPLDVPTVLRIGRQIAEGLAAAHAQDLIHRDIKPANILLETGAREMVKVTDFGLARAADDASLTQSGLIAGTPMYMAPEQALGHKLDQRADLFSFGSVLYQMLSGRPPFRAETTVAVLRRVVEDAPRPIREIIPEVPDWMCELVGHLHAKNPNDRFASAREVSELLARCASELQAGRVPKIPDPSRKTRMEEPPAVNVEPISSCASEPRRRRSLVTTAAAAVILFAALGLTEATGITHFASTVIRLSTGSGTLVIETEDPGVKIAIDGEEVQINGAGIEKLTLRAGQYKVVATKDDKPVRQELVSISRNGRTTVRMSLEPDAAAKPITVEAPQSKPDVATHQWPADAPQPAIAPFDAEQAKKHQEAWAKHLGVPVEYKNSIGMKFVLIPPGEFLMGSTPEQSAENVKAMAKVASEQKRNFAPNADHTAPQHRVVLTQPIYLGIHEVTQRQFEQVLNRNPSAHSATGRYWKYVVGIDTQQFPVEMVSWNDAEEFCTKLSERECLTRFDFQKQQLAAQGNGTGYRLPTEAEWEAACRAGTTTKFWVGDNDQDLTQSDWVHINGERGLHQVGELRANPFGLFDVHGNIQEWVLDWMVPDYYSQFASSPAIDPLGPATAGASRVPCRVTRGGRFAAFPISAQSSKRGVYPPTGSWYYVGFRVALSVDAVKAAIQQTPPAVTKLERPLTTFTNSLGMEFVIVPKGKSWLGGGKDKLGDREVEIPADFYLGKYEVTQEEWVKVMGETPSHFSRTGVGKDAVMEVTDEDLKRFPVETVSWDECQLFVAKLNEREKETGWVYRLPTTTEWEYACRGGPMTDKANSAFDFYFAKPTNNPLREQSSFGKNMGLNRTGKVGSHEANGLGIFDMHRNVWEWCDDKKETADGNIQRVQMGGGWNHIRWRSAAANIESELPSHRSNALGLRLARVPSPEAKTPSTAITPFPDADLERNAALPHAEFRKENDQK